MRCCRTRRRKAILVSDDSRFDRWAIGQTDALTDLEKMGMNVFRGKAQCAECHKGPEFTSAATNLRDLNAGLPSASDSSESPSTTRYRQRTRTTTSSSSSDYAPSEAVTTEPAYTPQTLPPRTTPTRRSIIGGG